MVKRLKNAPQKIRRRRLPLVAGAVMGGGASPSSPSISGASAGLFGAGEVFKPILDQARAATGCIGHVR